MIRRIITNVYNRSQRNSPLNVNWIEFGHYLT